jgi:hypothetical protein
VKKINFTAELLNEKINVSFDETSTENTINRFIGFLMAKGENETLIKSAIKNVIDGKWITGLSHSLTISPTSLIPLTTVQISSLDDTFIKPFTYNPNP